MQAFFALKKMAVVCFVFMVVGCSSYKDFDEYIYEEDFFMPENEIVKAKSTDVTDEKVNELLAVSLKDVEVKRLEEETDTVLQPLGEGRFGSKEKAGLRKGLNAPVLNVNYGSQTRQKTDTVRSLALNEKKMTPAEKLEIEKAFLAKIVAPKKIELEKVEVVALPTAEKTISTIYENKDENEVENLQIQMPVEQPVEQSSFELLPPSDEIVLTPVEPESEPAVKVAPVLTLVPPKEQEIKLVQPEEIAEESQQIILIPLE